MWLDPREVRESFVAQIGPEVYACFTPGDQKIAQLELAMVLYALAVRAHSFRGRRGFWYIDNITALMSLIRGRSSSPDLERLAQLIHVAMFALRASFFFEYIPSKTNWADAVSRIGFKGPWIHQRGFSCHLACFPFQLVDLPSSRCFVCSSFFGGVLWGFSALGVSLPGVRYLRKVGTFSFISMPRCFLPKHYPGVSGFDLQSLGVRAPASAKLENRVCELPLPRSPSLERLNIGCGMRYSLR